MFAEEDVHSCSGIVRKYIGGRTDCLQTNQEYSVSAKQWNESSERIDARRNGEDGVLDIRSKTWSRRPGAKTLEPRPAANGLLTA